MLLNGDPGFATLLLSAWRLMPPGCKSDCTVQGFCQKNIQRSTGMDQTHFSRFLSAVFLFHLGYR
jgi:hypothetical protein